MTEFKFKKKFKDRLQWRDIIIKGIDTGYKISSHGDIINKKGKCVKSHKKKSGYYRVGIWLEGKRYEKSVHRLLMIAFEPILNCKLLQVNHIDGDKSNNWWSNLEWSTVADNMKHAWKNNLYKKPIGELNNMSKYTEGDIIKICEELMQGFSITEVSKKYNIQRQMIGHIYNKSRWKHVVKNYDFSERNHK